MKMLKLSGLFMAAALLVGRGPTPSAQAATVVPLNLRCEYAANPLGVEAAQPRLFWQFASAERGQRQSAFRVLAASSSPLLDRDNGDLWDSGKVDSDDNIQVPYAGKTLSSSQSVFWKIRVWDQDGQASPWSPPATWTMGLLQPSDWKAKWIGAEFNRAPGGNSTNKTKPLPLFRRQFSATQPVRRALIQVCGLGFYELRLNGRKVGDQVLDPGWTHYRKTCFYATYDVTPQINRGANVLGVMLGNGLFNVTGGRYVKFTGSFGQPRMILQMRLEYADGTSTEICSDDSWRTAPGPIEFSCIYGGEDYDARREQTGWDYPGFNDTAWTAAKVLDSPGGRLASQTAPPLKVMRVYPTVKITEPKPGVYVYDLGHNFSGWPQVSVRGSAGKTVKLIPGELLDANGLVSQRSSGGPVSFSYTLKGQGTEVWHPRFAYYGFRYVQVEGAARNSSVAAGETPQVVAVSGHFVHSSAATVGQFACSNPLFNQIHELIDRAIESNLQSVLTDCPHREKLGWLEVSHLLGPAIMMNYDVPALYRKMCQDMRESQLPNGLVPDIAPEYTVFSGGFRDSPEWGSACVINPWHLYERFGDRRALEENYEMMTRYVAYLGSQAKAHIVAHGLGDWYDIGPGGPGESKLTTKGLTATAIYYHDITLLEQAAQLLGKSQDAAKFAALAREVRDAFNRQFFHPESNQYDRASQTANAMPLVFGLANAERRADILDNLVKDVRAHGNHLTAGDVGYRYLLMALAQGGRSDVIFDMNIHTNPPSYGSQLARGATTLTEAWDADPASSQNHCMLGHAEEWFYSGLAGIQPDVSKPGFGQIIIRPHPVGNITWAKASYDSIRGKIVSDWKLADGHFNLEVTIPPNTTATVYLPGADLESMRENGEPVKTARGVHAVRTGKDHTMLDVGSGSFRFVGRIKP